MNDATTTDGLMTPAQAADFLGVKESSVKQWAKLNLIPHRRVRSLIRFDQAELDAWTKPEGDA